MTPQQLFDRFRADVIDLKDPPLWSDDEVWGYLDDAQSMLCRLTDGLRDSTSAATQVAITATEPWVDIDPSVLTIRSAKLVSTSKPVRVFSYEDVAGCDGTNKPWPWGVSDLDLPGTVLAAIIGMEEGRLRLVQVPIVDDALELIIERLPLVPITVGVRSVAVTVGGSGYTSAPTVVFSSGSAAATAVLTGDAVTSIVITEPGSDYLVAPTITFSGGGGTLAAATSAIGPPAALEVRREHHLAMLLWMKHLAYNKQDADTFDKERADKMDAAFRSYCFDAKSEKARRNQKPRTIAYGGL